MSDGTWQHAAVARCQCPEEIRCDTHLLHKICLKIAQQPEPPPHARQPQIMTVGQLLPLDVLCCPAPPTNCTRTNGIPTPHGGMVVAGGQRDPPRIQPKVSIWFVLHWLWWTSPSSSSSPRVLLTKALDSDGTTGSTSVRLTIMHQTDNSAGINPGMSSTGQTLLECLSITFADPWSSATCARSRTNSTSGGTDKTLLLQLQFLEACFDALVSILDNRHDLGVSARARFHFS